MLPETFPSNMNEAPEAGFFVTFEGGEGSNKTEAMQDLARHLMDTGRTVLMTKMGGTDEGEKLRGTLVSRETKDWEPMAELLVFTAIRVQHINKKIKPALSVGQIVLCDRYVHSTLAYQGAAGGIPERIIRDIHDQLTNSLWPDLTIVLDIDPDDGLPRARRKKPSSDRFESMDIEFHRKVRQSFIDQANASPERHLVVDGSQSREHIAAQIARAVDQKLAQRTR